MPEGRQRTISKAGNQFKGRTNETSECEEHGDEDDESAVNAFIEASCYNLRQLILSSVRKSGSNLPNNMMQKDCEGAVESKGKSRGKDLVVLGVVLNKEQKDNDEVILAIERLRKNGVTCAFFTMEDKHAKQNPKAVNGFISSTSQHSDTFRNQSDHGVLNPPVAETPKISQSLCQSQPTCELEQAQRKQKSYLSTTLRASKLEETSSVKTGIHTKNGIQEEKSVAAEQKSPRKRKRRRTFGRRKLQNSKNRPGKIVRVRLPRTTHRQNKNGTNVEGLQLTLSRNESFNSLTVEVAKVQDLPAQNVGNVPEATHDSIIPVQNASLHCQALPVPGKEHTSRRKHSPKAEAEPGSCVVNANGNSKDVNVNHVNAVSKNAIPAQTRSTTLIRKQKKAKTFEQSLAKFCLGERATKSIAAERIKKCLKEPTKKLTRVSPQPQVTTSPLSNGVTLPTASRKRKSSESENRKARDAGRNKSEKIGIPYELKRLEMWSEKRNGSLVKAEDQLETLDSETSFRAGREHFPDKSRKRPRRISMSPDIVTLAAPKPKPKLPSKPQVLRQSQSAPASGSTVSNMAPSPCPLAQARPSDTTMASGNQQGVRLEQERRMAEVKDVLRDLVDKVVLSNEVSVATKNEQDSSPGVVNVQSGDLVMAGANEGRAADHNPTRVAVGDKAPHSADDYIPRFPCSDDSLPDSDAMQLRRSSFYALIAGNVRTNMENYLDGKNPDKTDAAACKRRRRVVKNGFLLHHGDNCPEDPESPYKFHLATQVLLKLNKRRSKCSPKEERTKNVLSYLKLVPKRSGRLGKNQHGKDEDTAKLKTEETPTFSGDWTFPRKYICGVCSQVEHSFWDMVTHKGENHPGVVVTHVELPDTQTPPASLIRQGPGPSSDKAGDANANTGDGSLNCTKCHATFSVLSDLHRHIFECAGNASWLVEKAPCKRKPRRRRGFKRRLSNTPKKPKKVEGRVEPTKKASSSQVLKCTFCTKEFKTEGWLKNHVYTHSLPVSIPLDKLPLPVLPPVRAYLRKCK